MDALAMFWADHPELAARKNKVPATYTIAYQPLAASAVGASAMFQAAADFVVTTILGTQTTTVTNAAYIATPLIIQIVLGSRNMNFNATKTEWSTAGLANNPAINAGFADLPYPLYVPFGMQITTLVDNPLAVAANVWITFVGIQCNS